MENSEHLTTKQKILSAAQEIFIEKGKDGARMQEIAHRAGANKAMLFYYFTNKDSLYMEVLRHNLTDIFMRIKTVILSEITTENKLEQIVNTYINFFQEHQDLPKLMLREIASGGETVKQIITELKQHHIKDIPNAFINMIQKRIDEKQFRDVDPFQTILSIIGMSIIYFLGKPILEVIFNLENFNENKFLEQREKSIVDLLENGLLVRE